MTPRWINRLYAWVAGYFWIPCPRCGLPFGGHESGGTDHVYGSSTGWMTCWRCPEHRTLMPSGVWMPGHWVDIDGDMREVVRWTGGA